MKRRTKSQYFKELSKKNSERAKRGWKTRHLRAQAEAGQWDSFEDIIGRERDDRKGKHYDTWTKASGVIILITYSYNRSDQFDIVISEPKKWSSGHKQRTIRNLSMPKLLKLWPEL